MNDTALPTLKQTAVEFLVQTNHQPLYRIAELLTEREQQCTQIGYDRAVAELTDKLSKQEQGGVDQMPAPLLATVDAHKLELTEEPEQRDTEPPQYPTPSVDDSPQQSLINQLAFLFTGIKSSSGPSASDTIRRAAALVIDSYTDSFFRPRFAPIRIRESLRNDIVGIAKYAIDNLSGTTSNLLTAARRVLETEEFSQEHELKSRGSASETDSKQSEEKWRETAKVDSKTLEGDGGIFDAIEAAHPTQRATDINKLTDWVLNNGVGIPVNVHEGALRLRRFQDIEIPVADHERFQGLVIGDWVGIARRLWQLLDDIDTTGDRIKPSGMLGGSWRTYFDAVQKLHSKRHLELKSDGYVLTPLIWAKDRIGQTEKSFDAAQEPHYESDPSQSVAVHAMAHPSRLEANAMLQGLLRDTSCFPKDVQGARALIAAEERSNEHRRALQLLLADYIERATPKQPSKRDGLSLPARREQLEIMLSRYKRTALDEACEPETLDHALTAALAHVVLQLIVLQGF